MKQFFTIIGILAALAMGLVFFNKARAGKSPAPEMPGEPQPGPEPVIPGPEPEPEPDIPAPVEPEPEPDIPAPVEPEPEPEPTPEPEPEPEPGQPGIIYLAAPGTRGDLEERGFKEYQVQGRMGWEGSYGVLINIETGEGMPVSRMIGANLPLENPNVSDEELLAEIIPLIIWE